MNISKEQAAKFALGVVIIVPCAIAGKFLGAIAGGIAGGFVAFNAAESAYDFVKAKITH